MLRIEIDIPRPRESAIVISLVGCAMLWGIWIGMGRQDVSAREQPREEWNIEEGEGGPDLTERAFAVRGAEEQARRIRIEQAVLGRREEILRYEFKLLEDRARETEGEPTESDIRELRESQEELLKLINDQRSAEERFRETLRQMWEAEGISMIAAVGSAGDVVLHWPAEPRLGLSAYFLDAAYELRFGIEHHAIDIPLVQGSDIRAAADGVVEKVADNGMGYSYLILRHEGVATLYGHASEFYVSEGQRVRQGQVIAASGGLPGTKGAGALTTGSHLHFEVIVDGAKVDPLTYLPRRSEVKAKASGE